MIPKPARITANTTNAGPSRSSPPSSLNPVMSSPPIVNQVRNDPSTMTAAPPISNQAAVGALGRGGAVVHGPLRRWGGRNRTAHR